MDRPTSSVCTVKPQTALKTGSLAQTSRRLSEINLRSTLKLRLQPPMKSVTLVINESTDARLKALAQRCDTTPGEFVDFLCAALDGETLQRVIQRAIRDDSVTSEPGIARMPVRRIAK